MAQISAENIQGLEKRFVSAWTGAGSTPFIVDVVLSDVDLELATKVVQSFPISRIFELCPTVACWGTLKGLSDSYDGGNRHVYEPISDFLEEPLGEAWQRDTLKHNFRRKGRAIGLPVVGTEPTSLFFGAVGPVKSMYSEMAHAFIFWALSFGVPATEDTTAARVWQRRAVNYSAPNLKRLQVAVQFDQSAFLAQRFEAWRQGSDPLSQNERELFSAYDRAAAEYGRKRKDLIGPPVACWSADRLGLEAEKSDRAQIVVSGVVQKRLTPGGQKTLDAPWDEKVSWKCGTATRQVPFAPSEGELLLFDADTGRLIKRAALADGAVTVACETVVALAAKPFENDSFGDAIPARDPRYFVLWAEAGESLRFADGSAVVIERPVENAIWIAGNVFGRSGSRVLYSSQGSLVGRLDPDVGGRTRILRTRHGDQVKFFPFSADEDGAFAISFDQIGLSESAGVERVVFDVLAPGAAGDENARSEIKASAWLWPASDYSGGQIDTLPIPQNYSAAHSRGLRAENGELFVNLAADGGVPLLGVIAAGTPVEFEILTRAETLAHTLVNTQETALVPRGRLVTLAHENRHDTFRIKSEDKQCDLLVLGKLIKRPFLGAGSYEIGASKLTTEPGGDDRIALCREDGSVTVFARLRRIDDPAQVSISIAETSTVLRFKPAKAIDALRITVTSVSGDVQSGQISLGRLPVEGAAPRGITARFLSKSGPVEVSFVDGAFSLPSLAKIEVRKEGERIFSDVPDVSGYQMHVGLGPEEFDNRAVKLVEIAQLASFPTHGALEAHFNATLGKAFEKCLEHHGSRRMVGAIKPALLARSTTDAAPRLDLISAASWIFEAPFSAFSNLSADCGLHSLGQGSDLVEFVDPPSPLGENPLQGWLDRITHDVNLPNAVDAKALENALRMARFRMRETDLRLLIGSNPTATVVAAITSPWRGTEDALRKFDTDGGGDDRITRVAATIESFASSCAVGQSQKFVQAVTSRTGFASADVGRALTLMIRADVEVFVYFKSLWHAGFKKGN